MAIMQETEDEKFNVSINIIGTESPEPAVMKIRRPIHSRSNSDVTPCCVCPPSPLPPAPPPPTARPHPRSRSLGARPSHKQAVKHQQALSLQKTSPSHLAVDFSPHLEISTLSSILAKCEKTTSPVCSPRKIRSEQTSPSVSVISIPEANPHPRTIPGHIDKSSSQLVYVPSDPWTKQSDSDVKTMKKLARTNLSLECSPADNGPWILNSSSKGYSQSQRQLYRKAKSFSKQKSTGDNRKVENISNLAVRRNSKLERLSPVSCNTCWSTDMCKCSKADDNLSLNIPLSPAFLDRSPDLLLAARSSPVRLTAEKQIVIKKSPVVLKKNTRSLSVSGVKCLHDLASSQTNGKVDMVCTCNALKQGWISPRPSPRKSVPRSEYLSLSKDCEVDLSKVPSRKNSFSKVASTNNSPPVVSDTSNSPPQKITNCDVSDVTPRAEGKEPGITKPVEGCDPLLETTC